MGLLCGESPNYPQGSPHDILKVGCENAWGLVVSIQTTGKWPQCISKNGGFKKTGGNRHYIKQWENVRKTISSRGSHEAVTKLVGGVWMVDV